MKKPQIFSLVTLVLADPQEQCLRVCVPCRSTSTLINDMIEGPIPNEEKQAVPCETHITPDALSGVSNLARKENGAPKGKILISLAMCID